MKRNFLTKSRVGAGVLTLALVLTVGVGAVNAAAAAKVAYAYADAVVDFNFNVAASKPVQQGYPCKKITDKKTFTVKVTYYANYTEVSQLRVRAWDLKRDTKASIFRSVKEETKYNFWYNDAPEAKSICRLDGDVSANATQNGGVMKGKFTP